LFYVLACACGLLLAFSGGPSPGLTGDFGQLNCTDCHTGNPLNAAGGTLSIEGLPAQYNPGQTYPITVRISKSGQQRWGFQLSARFASGGAQAGTLIVTSAATTQILTQSNIQYIEHTSQGTQSGAAQGTWTFNWQAPSPASGAVRLSVAGNAANGNGSNSGDFIYTASATTNPAAEALPLSLLFSHIAVGGGYTTTFTITNTGSDTATGNLFLTTSDGTPLDVTLSSPSAIGADERIFASSSDVIVPPGGTQIINATAPGSTQVLAGWARVESSGGELSGVATFQFRENGALKTVAGVLAAEPEDAFTIPVDDDGSRRRFTGYAVANQGSEEVRITLLLVDRNGTVTQTLNDAIVLAPGEHTARFLFQDLNDPGLVFQGSVVLRSAGGRKFGAVALVQVEDPDLLFTAIPVIKGMASGLGN